MVDINVVHILNELLFKKAGVCILNNKYTTKQQLDELNKELEDARKRAAQKNREKRVKCYIYLTGSFSSLYL